MTEDLLNWNFERAHEFSRAFGSDVPDNTGKRSSISSSSYSDYVPCSLGDFTRVYDAFGIDLLEFLDSPPPFYPERNGSVGVTAAALPSSYSSSYSSSLEPAENFEDFVNSKSKGVRWHDEIEGETLPKQQTNGQNSQDPAVHKHRGHGQSDEVVGISFSPVKLTSSLNNLSPQKKAKVLPGCTLLDNGKYSIQSVDPKTEIQQKRHLMDYLMHRFPDPKSTFITDPVSTAAIPNGIMDPNGIHVFVDFSNIHIGFKNRMKTARKLPENAYLINPPFSFHGLTLMLERGRPVARRILAGSSNGGTRKGSVNFDEAEACGFENNILARVLKQVPANLVHRKRHGTGNGYATSGDESDTILCHKEQAVDEILQMKLLESLVDTAKPGTIVLASGDAAEAEYSGGFLKNVERALVMNWKVEVVGWRHGMSSDYKNPGLVKRWGSKFKVIELDDFAEDLLAVYV